MNPRDLKWAERFFSPGHQYQAYGEDELATVVGVTDIGSFCNASKMLAVERQTLAIASAAVEYRAELAFARVESYGHNFVQCCGLRLSAVGSSLPRWAGGGGACVAPVEGPFLCGDKKALDDVLYTTISNQVLAARIEAICTALTSASPIALPDGTETRTKALLSNLGALVGGSQASSRPPDTLLAFTPDTGSFSIVPSLSRTSLLQSLIVVLMPDGTLGPGWASATGYDCDR